MRALKQVKRNKGVAGIDGMTVEELPEYLTHHWPEIKSQLLNGHYRPQAVKRVEIPKPDGRKRKLGIPTVIDRVIQQAIAQVLAPIWPPHSPPQLRIQAELQRAPSDIPSAKRDRTRSEMGCRS